VRSGNPKVAAAAAERKGAGDAAPDAPHASTRYTPPSLTKAQMPSPMWVPVLMFVFFGVGVLLIFLNYTGVMPGAPDGWYLVGGLGAILFGIITATQYR